jgi:carboxylesterase type B
MPFVSPHYNCLVTTPRGSCAGGHHYRLGVLGWFSHRAQREQMRGSEAGLYPIPTILRDGVVLPTADPLQQLARGEFNQVPVILGTNRDEMKAMMSGNPDYTRSRFGVLPQVEDQALYDRVTGYGSNMWKAIGADEPARAMAATGHEDIFVYRFDWDDLPSC